MTIIEKTRTDVLVYIPTEFLSEIKSRLPDIRKAVTYTKQGKLIGIQLWIPKTLLESLQA